MAINKSHQHTAVPYASYGRNITKMVCANQAQSGQITLKISHTGNFTLQIGFKTAEYNSQKIVKKGLDSVFGGCAGEKVSIWAALSQSNETTSVRLEYCKVKCWSLHSSTLNGPSYTGYSDFLTHTCNVTMCYSVILPCITGTDAILLVDDFLRGV